MAGKLCTALVTGSRGAELTAGPLLFGKGSVADEKVEITTRIGNHQVAMAARWIVQGTVRSKEASPYRQLQLPFRSLPLQCSNQSRSRCQTKKPLRGRSINAGCARAAIRSIDICRWVSVDCASVIEDIVDWRRVVANSDLEE